MGITVRYGDEGIGQGLEGAYRAGRARAQRENRRLDLQAASNQTDQMNALARGAAIQAGERQNTQDNETRASISSAENETRASLAEAGMEADVAREGRGYSFRREESERNQGFQREMQGRREEIDERNDARAYAENRHRDMVRQGIGLSPQELQELQKMQGTMGTLDADQTISPTERMRMQQQVMPQLLRLQERQQAAARLVAENKRLEIVRSFQRSLVPVDDNDSPPRIGPDGQPMRYPADHIYMGAPPGSPPGTLGRMMRERTILRQIDGNGMLHEIPDAAGDMRRQDMIRHSERVDQTIAREMTESQREYDRAVRQRAQEERNNVPEAERTPLPSRTPSWMQGPGPGGIAPIMSQEMQRANEHDRRMNLFRQEVGMQPIPPRDLLAPGGRRFFMPPDRPQNRQEGAVGSGGIAGIAEDAIAFPLAARSRMDEPGAGAGAGAGAGGAGAEVVTPAMQAAREQIPRIIAPGPGPRLAGGEAERNEPLPAGHPESLANVHNNAVAFIEQIPWYQRAGQDFKHAKNITRVLSAALQEGRRLTPDELARYNRLLGMLEGQGRSAITGQVGRRE